MLRKYKKTVLVPTGQFANVSVGVEFDFEDQVSIIDAWKQVDEAITHQTDLIEAAQKLERDFEDQKPKPRIVQQVGKLIDTAEVKMCDIHNLEMSKGISKKTQKPYWFHDNEKKERCFGNGFLARGYSA